MLPLDMSTTCLSEGIATFQVPSQLVRRSGFENGNAATLSPEHGYLPPNIATYWKSGPERFSILQDFSLDFTIAGSRT